MSPATEAKAAAIRAGLKTMQFDPAGMLAMLTSADRNERERAKRDIRELVSIGHVILREERTAAELASFANRHEP